MYYGAGVVSLKLSVLAWFQLYTVLEVVQIGAFEIRLKLSGFCKVSALGVFIEVQPAVGDAFFLRRVNKRVYPLFELVGQRSIQDIEVLGYLIAAMGNLWQ